MVLMLRGAMQLPDEVSWWYWARVLQMFSAKI